MRMLEGHISLPYRWAMGPVISRFYDETKKNKKIWGTRCPQCHRVLVPARKFCPRCFVDTPEWVEVKDEGKIRTWILVNYSYVGQPKAPPYVIGVIVLDGADVGFTHFIGDVDVSDVEKLDRRLQVGTRVKAVWARKREGTIFDIQHFAPV